MSDGLKIAVFASHGGSNLQAIIDACETGKIRGKVAIMISNNSKAYALERARNHGIETLVLTGREFATEEEFGVRLISELENLQINLICLAGYMKKIPSSLIKYFHNRMINIHPALLPKFGGQGMYGIHVHEAVLAAGEHETGVTVHLVDEVYDHGKIVAKEMVPVLPGDTAETLQARVLEVEHELYPATVARISTGELKLE